MEYTHCLTLVLLLNACTKTNQRNHKSRLCLHLPADNGRPFRTKTSSTSCACGPSPQSTNASQDTESTRSRWSTVGQVEGQALPAQKRLCVERRFSRRFSAKLDREPGERWGRQDTSTTVGNTYHSLYLTKNDAFECAENTPFWAQSGY